MTGSRSRRIGWSCWNFWAWGIATGLFHGAGLYCLQRTMGQGAERAVLFLKWQLGLWLVASLCWLGALWALRRGALPSLFGVVLLGLLLRLPGLFVPVTHSNDIYRYLWDGAVQRAGLDPYAGPPESPLYAPVRAALPEVFLRINHRHLPTIYPPAAQLFFKLSARIGPAPRSEPEIGAAMRCWKALCGLGELLLWLTLLGLLRGESAGARWLALWALSPLPAIEIWVNGHLDGVGLLFLSAALLALSRRRGVLAGALWMLAALIKPLAVAVVPGLLRQRPTRRMLLALFTGVVLAGLAAWFPYRQAGLQVAPSLGEYGRRWRSNDGAYALLHRAAEAGVALSYAPPYYEPWKRRNVARLITGRDRDTVWPDELASFLARGAAFALLCGLLGAGLYARLLPAPMALLLLTGYALLTPTLHPWYLLWPLLFAGLWRAGAAPVLALVALAPLGYLPLSDEWRGLSHHETIWARLVQHGAAWIAVAVSLAVRRLHNPLGVDSNQESVGKPGP